MANFMLRIDDDLHEKLKQLAEKEKRSLNKEVEYILEKYIKEGTSK